MKPTRLQTVKVSKEGDHIMVIARTATAINENDYYLMNNDLIRKGQKNSNEPKYIVVIHEKNELVGRYKLLNDTNNTNVICWVKEYACPPV